MDRALQQRLVGILVLTAVILLIAPVLFDAEGRIPEKITNIPPQPKAPDLSHISFEVPVTDSLIEPEPAETIIENPNGFVEPSVPAVIKTQPKTGIWSVQVASFKDSEKALKLISMLKEADYEVYSREKTLSDGTLFTQVFVGPEAKKEQAETKKSDIKAAYNLQGLVVKFSE
ncbi:SPOR domain-containing protein [Reinekea sp.]|uniref:SPOR domain-containing protein n=1 Tax=Reinekea sp. TaxID=1970455 RepID=UPI003989D776